MLVAVEFFGEEVAAQIHEEALSRGLILNIKHGTIIRIFPALTITEKELDAGLEILEEVIAAAAGL
ncbi:MAG: aminotransferase class III-fold pyridoxal phosphate-dependent enzyme [Chitinispirillaceae bacterium]|nr:aminotransferase class III-fold pyridoxal phosphate-dependent enzyme [Chitinispirillaceae bacterium]